jgi:hypothetical protein
MLMVWLVLAFVVGAAVGVAVGWGIVTKTYYPPGFNAVLRERDQAIKRRDAVQAELEELKPELELLRSDFDGHQEFYNDRLELEIETLHKRIRALKGERDFKAAELERVLSGVSAFAEFQTRGKKTAAPPLSYEQEEAIIHVFRYTRSIRETGLRLFGYDGGRAYREIKRVLGLYNEHVLETDN